MDGELIGRCRTGDREAFGRLVERYQGLVFGVALATTRDAARAEDVAQEAFVVAWRELGRLREVEKFGGWVAGIARNLARTQRRSWARRRSQEERAEAAPEADERTPFDELATREDRALLEEALAAVPEAHREALVLYYLEGESIAEVARRLGISEALMKQRLSRGRRALRGSWAERLGPALVRARPGAAFTAAVVASVGASAITQAAPVGAGKALTAMSITKKASIAVAVAAVGGGVVWYKARARAESAPAVAAPAPVAAAAPAPSAAPTPRPRARRIAPAERAALVERIAAARAAAGGPRGKHYDYAPDDARRATASRPDAPALPPGDLDKNVIRTSVRALLPLIQECYEEGLERVPALAGDIVVHFTIDGEPEVGGVIGESTIVEEGTTLVDPQVLECVKETMYGIEIDPPSGGGVVEVTYPFRFSTAEE